MCNLHRKDKKSRILAIKVRDSFQVNGKKKTKTFKIINDWEALILLFSIKINLDK
jgi:hypothetical protein